MRKPILLKNTGVAAHSFTVSHRKHWTCQFSVSISMQIFLNEGKLYRELRIPWLIYWGIILCQYYLTMSHVLLQQSISAVVTAKIVIMYKWLLL